MRSMPFATIFATTKTLAAFKEVNTFEIGFISGEINNRATENVINTMSTFVGELVSTNKQSLIMVIGARHRPNHYGTSMISVNNYERNIFKMQLPEALHFPSSPVSVLSIGRFSKHPTDIASDVETRINLTGDVSWFS